MFYGQQEANSCLIHVSSCPVEFLVVIGINVWAHLSKVPLVNLAFHPGGLVSGGASQALIQGHNLVPAFTILGKSSHVPLVHIIVLFSCFFPSPAFLYTLQREWSVSGRRVTICELCTWQWYPNVPATLFLADYYQQNNSIIFFLYLMRSRSNFCFLLPCFFKSSDTVWRRELFRAT